MKWYFRRAAAVVLAVALFTPTIADASVRLGARERDKTELVLRFINAVKRAFGVSANSDVLGPPVPAPAPPPPPPPPTTT